MQELKFEQVEDVNGGVNDTAFAGIAAAEDVMVVGPAVAAAVFKLGTPVGWAVLAVGGAYYGGKALGSWLFASEK
jgi:hypothetical protein